MISSNRFVFALGLACTLLFTPGRLRAQVEVLVESKAIDPTGPLTLDIHLINAISVGSLTLELQWNPALLRTAGSPFTSVPGGVVSTDIVSYPDSMGVLLAAMVFPSGVSGSQAVLTLSLEVPPDVILADTVMVLPTRVRAHDINYTVLAVELTEGVLTVDTATLVGVGPRHDPSPRPMLGAPYPNPFLTATSIHLHLETVGDAEVAVFDPRGRRIRLLHAGRTDPGASEFIWTGLDDRGVLVPPGVYFIRARTPLGTGARKVVRLAP